MIEARIDIHWMLTQQNNIMHSITMMQMLRESGMPVIGKIIFNGPQRGTLIQERENTLDGDEWIVRWFDTHEPVGDSTVTWHLVESGHGKGFTWRRFSLEKPTAQQEDDW